MDHYDVPLDRPTALESELLRAAMGIAAWQQVAGLLYICDQPPPSGVHPGAEGKLIHVVSSASLRDALDRLGERAVLVPGYEMDRQDRFKLALIGATARGYLRRGDHVVGLVGARPVRFPDTLFVIELEQTAVETTLFGELGAGRVSPSVFDAIIELAIELGVEGWEGHALGTMFVVGGVEEVMRASRQLVLNPFRGYAEDERNLSDPAVRQALRSFATLDGTFVVREDGVVMAAGRYLEVTPSAEVKVPLGLGARHMAAALTTAATDAIAVVVSQTSGQVRVFRQGATVLELTPSHRRI